MFKVKIYSKVTMTNINCTNDPSQRNDDNLKAYRYIPVGGVLKEGLKSVDTYKEVVYTFHLI